MSNQQSPASKKWTNEVSRHDGGGNLHSFEHFTGTRVEVIEGSGTEENPVRVSITYFDEAGELIATIDRWKIETQALPEATASAEAGPQA